MTKKVILALSIILLLASTLVTEASANLYGDVSTINFIKNFDFGSKQSSSYSIEIKKATAYDESKDPTLRKGTENEEESQISFFIMPAVTLGIALLILFFRQK